MAIFYTDSASFDNVTITQNLTVLGTSSATFTENLIVDSNTIKLGNSQLLRYAGIEFVDSGSSPITSASILYDSTNDQMIFYHNGGVTSSVFLLGPETYNNLGNETYLTANRIPKGTGIEHLEDSNITDTGTLVSIVGPLSASGGITGSGFFGTASFADRSTTASFATTSSFAVSASWAPGGGGVTINNNTNNYVLTATGTANTINGEASLTFDDVTGTLGVTNISSDGLVTFADVQVNQDSTFDGLAAFNAGVLIDVATISDRLTVTGLTILSGSTSVTGSFQVLGGITGSLLGTASQATTASFAISASWAPGGEQGASFPYDGRTVPAVISGSLEISSSITTPLDVYGSINDFFEVAIQNTSSGNNASSDFVATSNNGTDLGNYINMGINSTGYNSGLVGNGSDGYLYLTSSAGELHIGNASPGAGSNIRLFTGGPSSDTLTRMFISSSGQVGIGTVTPSPTSRLHVQGGISASAMTGSLTAGSLTNITEMSLVTSGTIAAPAGTTVTLNLNGSNFFVVSASGAGTVTWTATNPAPAPRVQAIVVEYVNGGAVTNSWFSGIRWSGGVAPTLTTGANPDFLSFFTDDAGTLWRGTLLQRNSS